MGREDWYRSTEWNDEIEKAFYAKLKRAREKSQYIRIQANYLVDSHPQIALRLIDEYFQIDPNFSDASSAWLTRAKAHLNMGNLEAAFDAYEGALAREAAFPNSRTTAALDYPLLIAQRHVASRYERALEILDGNKEVFLFAAEIFRWNAAKAIILAAWGDAEAAHELAQAALEAARIKDSGLRYHPNVGLVGDKNAEIMEFLEEL